MNWNEGSSWRPTPVIVTSALASSMRSGRKPEAVPGHHRERICRQLADGQIVQRDACVAVHDLRQIPAQRLQVDVVGRFRDIQHGIRQLVAFSRTMACTTDVSRPRIRGSTRPTLPKSRSR